MGGRLGPRLLLEGKRRAGVAYVGVCVFPLSMHSPRPANPLSSSRFPFSLIVSLFRFIPPPNLMNRDAKALQDKIAQKQKAKAEAAAGGGGSGGGGGGGDKKKEKNAYTVFIK